MSETRARNSPMNREVELKLAIGSAGARRAADQALGRAPVRWVETTYFDTPHRRLRAAGFSLRLRHDGEAWSQSVKSLGGFDRFEQERAAPSGLPDFSLLGGTPVAPLVSAGESLSPVFTTRIRRRSRRRATGGNRIEFSLDEGEVIADGRSWPIHELELELKSGAPEALFDEGRRLASGEAFIPAFVSKAERGFALADGILGAPAKIGGRPLDREMAAGDAFRLLARRCLRQLSLNAELLTAAAVGQEALHQARVGLRRLRVVMDLFEPLLSAERSSAVEIDLRWLDGELGEARNLDVLSGDISGSHTSAGVLADAVHIAQGRAHLRAAAALASPRFRLLLLGCARWVECPGEPLLEDEGAMGGALPVAEFARQALDKRRRVMRRRLDGLDWGDPKARHRLRMATKKMRYASEFFIGLGPAKRSNRYRPFARLLSSLQEGLGELNDIAVAEPILLRTVREAAEGQTHADELGYAAGKVMGAKLARARKRLKGAKRDARALLAAPIWW